MEDEILLCVSNILFLYKIQAALRHSRDLPLYCAKRGERTTLLSSLTEIQLFVKLENNDQTNEGILKLKESSSLY